MASKRAHGTAGRYAQGPDENDLPGKGCRCTRCTRAATRTRQLNKLAALEGRGLRLVDAEPVREHVRWLIGQGMMPSAVAREAGVIHTLLTRLLHGHPKTGKPIKRLRYDNADAVLSVLPSNASMLFVPVVASQRRVRGLMWQGWPREVIAEHARLPHQRVWSVVIDDGTGRISAGTARRIQVATSRLLTRDPIAAGIKQGRVELARRRAIAAGWVSLLAWDDIEDPDSALEFGEKVSREQALVENIEELIYQQGYKPEHAAERLGISVNYLSRLQWAQRKQADAVKA